MSRKAKAPACPDAKSQIVKMIDGLRYRHNVWQVFSDFVEMSAISLSNGVDRAQFDKREERYLQIVKGYQPEELAKFPEMFAALVLDFEHEPSDVLGRAFHDLELHNHWLGQYFSPYTICQMMARMLLAGADDLKAKIEERGFIRAAEPSCGSGAMMIALAQEMRTAGINYQQHLHVTATDVDLKCVQMCYVQCSLLHIPAVVIHGNSLSLEEYSHWFTPAHIIGGWSRKLRPYTEIGEPPAAVQTPAIEPSINIPMAPPAAPVAQLSLF